MINALNSIEEDVGFEARTRDRCRDRDAAPSKFRMVCRRITGRQRNRKKQIRGFKHRRIRKVL